MAFLGERQTVDLSGYPDLVVIYLGMRARSLRGLWTLLKTGPQIDRAVAAKPDGLLLHERLIWSILPPHFGMRQYWRDFDSLECWARGNQHLAWWLQYGKTRRGFGFWHEVYSRRGPMEGLYSDVPALGFGKFAPVLAARGRAFTARQRLALEGEGAIPVPIPEAERYAGE